MKREKGTYILLKNFRVAPLEPGTALVATTLRTYPFESVSGDARATYYSWFAQQIEACGATSLDEPKSGPRHSNQLSGWRQVDDATSPRSKTTSN